MTKWRPILRCIPAALGIAVIPLLSLLPPIFFNRIASGVALFPNADKVVHACMYASLAAAFCFAIPRMTKARPFLYIAVGASLYGALMELAQKWFTAARSCDPYDMLANAAGAFLAASLYYLLRRQRANKERAA